jgi:Protein kinase domain
MHYAHALRDAEGNTMHVVHRDVSPQNLFVTVDGVCKVLDFGVSKVMTDGPRTKSGVIKGKLPYMPPEQIRGEAIDGRADIFALGVCLWEALTAQRLFDRPTDFLIWKAITEEEVPTIRSHWPECPPSLDAVVMRALDRDPANRFATARDFADALRAACPLPPCTPAEIADAVKARCGDRIAERQREVATALRTRGAAPEFDTATTTDRGVAASMEVRQQSMTLDLRTEARRARLAAEEEAAETRDLRRDAAATRTVEPPGESIAESTVEPLPKSRGHWRMLLVAILAAAATAVLVVVLMRREDRTPVVQQAPPPPVDVVTPPPPDAAAPVVVETPVDAAPVATTKKKLPKKTTTTRKQPTTEEVDTTVDSETMGVHEAAETTKRAGDDLRRSMEKLRDSLQK